MPVVRAAALKRYGPGVATVLDGVSALLSTDALRELNGLMDIAGDPPAKAAAEWLERRGLATAPSVEAQA